MQIYKTTLSADIKTELEVRGHEVNAIGAYPEI